MRKFIAVVLVIGISICFAACGKDDTDDTTLPNLLQTNTSIEQIGTDVSVTTNQNAESTMILTTKAGETAPQVSTTAFVPDSAALTLITSAISGTAINIASQGELSVPSVVTSQAPATIATAPVQPTAQPVVTPTGAPTSQGISPSRTDNTTATTSTTAAPTTKETTTALTRTSKAVAINDIATTSDKKMIVTLDSSGWNGNFKNNSSSINVKIDGVDLSAPCSVKSGAKNSDGYQYITIDLGNLSLSEGSKVQFTVPSAFLQTQNGEQYNSAFSGSYTVM